MRNSDADMDYTIYVYLCTGPDACAVSQ